MQGMADLQGFGNGLANVIYGNTGNNLLDGGAGVDLMVGGPATISISSTTPATPRSSAGEGNDAVFATPITGCRRTWKR